MSHVNPPGTMTRGELLDEVDRLRRRLEGLREVDIVFDGPPGSDAPRFVEAESGGRSVRIGDWVQMDRGYWALRIQATLAEDNLEQGRTALADSEPAVPGSVCNMAEVFGAPDGSEPMEQVCHRCLKPYDEDTGGTLCPHCDRDSGGHTPTDDSEPEGE